MRKSVFTLALGLPVFLLFSNSAMAISSTGNGGPTEISANANLEEVQPSVFILLPGVKIRNPSTENVIFAYSGNDMDTGPGKCVLRVSERVAKMKEISLEKLCLTGLYQNQFQVIGVTLKKGREISEDEKFWMRYEERAHNTVATFYFSNPDIQSVSCVSFQDRDKPMSLSTISHMLNNYFALFVGK